MVQHALFTAADLGPVLPLSHERRPLVTFDRASTDPDVICDWYERWPDAGLGVHAGRSSLLVIDVEHPSKGGDDGFATLWQLENSIGELPETRTHSTKSGGMHLVFALPRRVALRSAQGLIRGREMPAPGIDIVTGSAVLRWPPTAGYALARDLDVQPLPAVWIEALGEAPFEIANEVPLPRDHGRAYAVAALANEAREFASLGDGRRVALNTVAFKLGRLCPPLMASEVIDALIAACSINGSLRKHGQRFCEQTITRSVRGGMKQPRRLAA